jgi:hypothetical protein
MHMVPCGTKCLRVQNTSTFSCIQDPEQHVCAKGNRTDADTETFRHYPPRSHSHIISHS